MRLWSEKHQNQWHDLYNFEDDDIEDFEGHDYMEEPESVDTEDMGWLFPKRGPGEFKNFKKKGKKKKKRSAKKKKK